ncbi:hypothetical protein TD95_002941 [Thielaviopsis punctulata]|uniref:VanZ-like domain-containing protein n=1 Tax=Thielaviopsis punctulata TaxID=72032 RepID=A0A0F4ZL81_9PEZI|nr:hypothetical protein TD95_002941 [Thielaviopsis punctulata]
MYNTYAGLTSLNFDAVVNDKFLHFTTFFILTLVFYWIVDTHRRRALNFTLSVCTGGLGVGSEFLQAILPNGRTFDVYDIVANVLGSAGAVALCSWYHGRMLDRRRQRRYNAVPGEEPDDLELGEGHETGIVHDNESGEASVPAPALTLEEEVDNWDENAEDNWDDNREEDDLGVGTIGDVKDSVPPKKRID